MKKKETTSTELIVLMTAVTTCMTQLTPVIDSYPIGGAILVTAIAIGCGFWLLVSKK